MVGGNDYGFSLTDNLTFPGQWLQFDETRSFRFYADPSSTITCNIGTGKTDNRVQGLNGVQSLRLLGVPAVEAVHRCT